MKKALVTGGCGFIGSNLTKELVKRGWQVDIVDDMSNGHLNLLEGLNTRILLNGSFYDAYQCALGFEGRERPIDEVLVIQDGFANDYTCNALMQGMYDVVFHQAAAPRVSYSVEQPYRTTDININKTVKLFQAARGGVDKIIWASSSSVYGGAEVLPTSEACLKDPKSPYAWQKSAIEDFAKLSCQLYDIDIVCLRYFNVFGPGQYGDSPYSTAVSAWCHAIKNESECRSDGDGKQTRDMCYVDNAVSANILAAISNKKFMGECYNISCGRRTSNEEILEAMKERFGDRVKVKHAPERLGDVKHTLADCSKARKDFGYEPLVHFWEGLEKTYEWWGLK
ncbi:GDP-mannose 4,6-dehydratase [Amylibacter sp.]|nr:GDP-mannose 4,6-dehydratase [Amylibacter sp.]